MVRHTGRPAKSGPRFPCGKPKPDRGDHGEAVFNRLKHAPPDVKDLFNPMLGSALGRLSPLFTGELTWTQVETGKVIGRIYGAYHRLTGVKPRSAPSPSYERAYTRASAETAGDLEARTRKAERRYAVLQGIIRDLPVSTADQARARDVIEDLCVDDRQPLAANLGSIRAILSRIAVALKVRDTDHVPTASVAVTASRPARISPAKLARSARDRAAYIEAHRMFGWNDDTIEMAWAAYQSARALGVALQDREQFRREKAAGQLAPTGQPG